MQQEIKEKMAVWDNTSTVEFWAFVSTALAVLFTLVDSVVQYIYSTTGDSFDCSKLLNGVEPITQTRPEEKTKTKRDKKEKMEKKEKKEKMRKRRKWGIGENGQNG